MVNTNEKIESSVTRSCKSSAFVPVLCQLSLFQRLRRGLQGDFALKAYTCLAKLSFAVGVAFIASSVFEKLT